MTRGRGDTETRREGFRRRVSLSPRLRVGFLALLIAFQVSALDVPPAPTQWVTDRAGILKSAEIEALNQKLRAFEDRSGAQFIIYIFPSLEGDSLEDFTIRTAEQWKVGQKKYDNGLILFVFVQDRLTRIETGYGLEGTITDAYASRVLRETVRPFFQRSDYAGGLNAAADQLIARIEGREAPVPVQRTNGEASATSCLEVVGFIFMVLFILFLAGNRIGCLFPFFWPGGITLGGGGRGGWSGGGGWGGGFSGGGGSFGGGGASGRW